MKTRGHQSEIVQWNYGRAPRTSRRPGIFLDRDGVINRRIVGGYITNWTEFKFVRGIKSVLAKLSKMGTPLIVLSNQAGVGKGIVMRAALECITKRFVAELAEAGARIDAVYYCPHIPSENCRCRKPKPGLLRRAATNWRLDLKRSVLIGDSLSDLEAARAVGCRAILLASRLRSLPQSQLASLAGVLVAGKLSDISGLVCRLLDQSTATNTSP